MTDKLADALEILATEEMQISKHQQESIDTVLAYFEEKRADLLVDISRIEDLNDVRNVLTSLVKG